MYGLFWFCWFVLFISCFNLPVSLFSSILVVFSFRLVSSCIQGSFLAFAGFPGFEVFDGFACLDGLFSFPPGCDCFESVDFSLAF